MRYRERLIREASHLSQLRSIGLSIPRRYWRLSSDLWRQARLRRRWPRPEHFARMTPEQFESYVRSIGLDLEVRDALAEYDGGTHEARMGARVQAPQGVADQR
jgi:hypothetical protein